MASESLAFAACSAADAPGFSVTVCDPCPTYGWSKAAVMVSLPDGRPAAEQLEAVDSLLAAVLAALGPRAYVPRAPAALMDCPALRHLRREAFYEFVLPEGAPAPEPRALGAGYAVRPLRPGGSDTRTVNDAWLYGDGNATEESIGRLASAGRVVGAYHARDGLVGWVARTAGGPIGMLRVREAHRRRGLARALVCEAVRLARAAGAGPVTCHIAKSNAASQSVFVALGFVNARDVLWCV